MASRDHPFILSQWHVSFFFFCRRVRRFLLVACVVSRYSRIVNQTCIYNSNRRAHHSRDQHPVPLAPLAPPSSAAKKHRHTHAVCSDPPPAACFLCFTFPSRVDMNLKACGARGSARGGRECLNDRSLPPCSPLRNR